MNKFENYLINKGVLVRVAIQYNRIAEKFLEWLKVNNLKAGKLKRSQLTDYLEQNRKAGNKERTVRNKEMVIRHYYFFLGTKHNPAKNWIKVKKEVTLPAPAFTGEELLRIYESIKPQSPVMHRDRCMLGLVLFQGVLRSELEELRISDIDFETGYVFIQGQNRTNSRKLKLEPTQMMHLYDYLNKYRNQFLAFKQIDTDKFFLSAGAGKHLNNSLSRLIKKLKRNYPQIENLGHLRGSVISNWEKKDGIIEAMTKAGHRYISSTQRYQTTKYDELQDLLKTKHPLENMSI